MSERLPPDSECVHPPTTSLEAPDRLPSEEEARNRQLAEWIARIAERDEVALGWLYDAVLARVYSLVLRIVRRPEVAEEVTEDVFFQIWRQADRFDLRRGRPLGWILTIARTRALDSLRGSGGRAQSSLAVIEADNESQIDDAPCDLLDACQQSGRLHAALEALDPLPRQIVALAFLRGFTHEEIAVHLELPLGTVKSHVRRALSSLHRRLVSQLSRTRTSS